MSETRRPNALTTRRAVALAVVALVAVLLPGTAATAAKPTPAPVVGIATQIVFTNVYTPSQPLPTGAPGAVGLWYAVQDVPFAADLEFVDDLGDPAPLSTVKTTTVSASYGTSLLGSQAVAPGGTSTSVALEAIADAATGIRLTASADTKPKPVKGTSSAFDVLLESNPIAAGRNSIGGAGGTATECIATPEAPVCADLLPPVGGSFGTDGLLSRGLCLAGDNQCLNSYVQALASVDGASTSNPATLIMKCDKTLCNGGAIQTKKLIVTLSSAEPSIVAPDCPAKGTVGPYDPSKPLSATNSPFCVDYVQSTRDNAGDTILYLLFSEDLKARFG